MRPSPARRAAFEILRRVEHENAYVSHLLSALDEHLRDDDRALCNELVLGVLRRQLWLDSTLQHFADRRIENLDLPVRLALQIGLYQLRFLTRIPASAAVNESANLVRAAGLKSAAAFVNAVLRRATREPDYDPTTNVADPLAKLAIESSHPTWLIERWVDAFGFDETVALARANNEPAPVAFRLTAKAVLSENAAAQIIEELQTSRARVARSQVAPAAWRVIEYETARAGRQMTSGKDPVKPYARAPVLLRNLSRAGLIYLQDEASQLVAHLLAAEASDRVLDVCAAPGSKTTHIAALRQQATIVAGDLYGHRLRTLRGLAATQGASHLQLLVHDATLDLPFADASFDRVLVDAPCSGTGTLRRNPEIRWRLKPSDIAELASKQKRILANAAATVRPGGLLLYSTCALEPDENEGVVADFMKEHAEFNQSPLTASPDLLTEAGAIRTWPHRHDVDGFFIMAWQRTSV